MIKEKDFQQGVVELARFNGWKVFHPYESRRCVPGYPDLTMVRVSDRRIIFAELKTEKGRLSEYQKEWGEALTQIASEDNAVSYYLWRPSDWDEIEKVLSR